MKNVGTDWEQMPWRGAERFLPLREFVCVVTNDTGPVNYILCTTMTHS